MTQSFYKILLDPSAHHLPLPPGFVSMQLASKFNKDPILRAANGGYSWRIRIKRIGDILCFTDGWKYVVEDMELGVANMLLFQLVNQTSFVMSVFRLDGCERILPQINYVDSDDYDDESDESDDYEEDGDDYNPSFMNNNIQFHRKKVDFKAASSFYKILLDPSAPYLALPPEFVIKQMGKKLPQAPMIKYANGRYSWSLKIGRIGDNYCFTNGWRSVVKDIQLEFADFIFFQLVNHSTFNMSVYGPNGCEKTVPRKTEHDTHVEEVNEVKKNIENGDDEDVDVDDDDPFFVVILKTTHKKMLRFPAGFEELIGIRSEGTMTMKNLNGREWHLNLTVDKSYRASIRYYFSYGWTRFRKENGLKEGDECVFKYIRSEGKLLLAKVTKNKCPPNPLSPPWPNKDYVMKRPRGNGPWPSKDYVMKRPRGNGPRKCQLGDDVESDLSKTGTDS